MTADVQAVYGLWWREVTRFLRSWSRVIGWVITPLLILGFLKGILVAPVSWRAIVLGWIAGGDTTAVIQSTLIIHLSIPLGFRLEHLWSLPVAVIALLPLAMTFIGVGLALASQFRDSQGSGC